MTVRKASVVIAGRFPAGTVVHLYAVADESVLRHEGHELVDVKRTDESGVVEFRTGVSAGQRYIAFGYAAGFPLSIRAVGSDGSSVLEQAPVAPDVVKHADGQLVDGEWRPLRRDEDRQVPPDEPSQEEELRGEALAQRARELNIPGRGSMTADELRDAIADHDRSAA